MCDLVSHSSCTDVRVPAPREVNHWGILCLRRSGAMFWGREGDRTPDVWPAVPPATHLRVPATGAGSTEEAADVLGFELAAE
jgi:hypothetical protein